MRLIRRMIRDLGLRRRDDGFALVTVLGISALLTIVTVAGFALAQQSLLESEKTKSESLAFQAANGGIDAAVQKVAMTGFRMEDFPLTIPLAELGSGTASVEVTENAPGDYVFTSTGTAKDGSTEIVRVRMYLMDLYGMNIAYGSGFNRNSSAGGKFNGNASIYGPFYTYEDLRQGDNIGSANAGGLGWGPVYIKSGTLDVKAGYLTDVSMIYVDPAQPDPQVVTAPTKVIRSVPTVNVPRVDDPYLSKAYTDATAESSDNIQGDPMVRAVTNTEVGTLGDPGTYTGSSAPGASSAYKVIDNDATRNQSLAGGLTIGSGASFGDPSHDFAWDAGSRVLTVWGTVFIDGPLTIEGGTVTYTGNGALVVNGPVDIGSDLVPQGGLLPGLCGDGVTRINQSFDPGKCLGIVTPQTIRLDSSTSANEQNPDGAPTHAGAFFADQGITIDAKVMLVGSLISQGIDVTGNNNMDLRTSPNLGQSVPKSMPGYGLLSQSVAVWTRQ